MNEQQIRDMKPGPTMDLALAEAFGWIAWEETRGQYKYVTFQRPGEDEPYKRSQNWQKDMDRYRQIPFSEIDRMKHVVCGVPEYSTDISAAWEVYEKVDLECEHSNLRHGKMGAWSCTFDNIWFDGAHTAPEAICKAALLAIGGAEQ
ncbi:BC1872 family protein [Paenibacillus ehimensis]|uniref:BC1872 family protein n=1 Tax=Paenibacillus ehimensis TaxID=79264 RepID=UPI00046F8852|nr:hypothetical protein [Paenibacillus ehimensis]